jgi:hypothetical protein
MAIPEPAQKDIVKPALDAQGSKIVFPRIAGANGTFRVHENLYEFEPSAQHYWRHKMEQEKQAKFLSINSSLLTAAKPSATPLSKMGPKFPVEHARTAHNSLIPDPFSSQETK